MSEVERLQAENKRLRETLDNALLLLNLGGASRAADERDRLADENATLWCALKEVVCEGSLEQERLIIRELQKVLNCPENPDSSNCKEMVDGSEAKGDE